jgi:hypothetical protein
MAETDDPSKGEADLPHAEFGTFVMSMATSVLVHLGEVPHPEDAQAKPNLTMARHTLDLLGMLQEKTRGNLTKEEQELLENLLYDLRLKYVAAKKK